ncbi:MAG: response regulator [Lacunisphaera sp.]|nr:response regulator [Lacunisphaera sp.]
MTVSPLNLLVNSAQPKVWKVLVIEDDPHWRSLIEVRLEGDGHTVLVAADGLAGLALAAERPDIILCDIDMPRLNGFGVLEALRQQPALRDIPFIFLTGKTTRADQRKGMVHGADDYITKPFQYEELVEAIAAVLAKRTALTAELRHHSDEHRRELTAPWAHELLTPLNGILGAAAVLESEFGSISRGELRELAASIRLSAVRQLALARKLMQHFQLESLREGGWDDPAAAIDAGAGLDDEAQLVAAQAGRAADLHVAIQPAAVRISAGWVQPALNELVENAFKFSSAGTPVTITGGTVDGLYRLEVADQGPGMTADECEHIAAFRQFRRAKQEQQGLGLGLAIVQNIAALHHGSLTLEPGPGGKGLRAILELPLAE